jgi:hypothetical protein
MINYKATEENLQHLIEGETVVEILVLRDSPNSPYGDGSNLYIKFTNGVTLVIETEHAELTLTREV